MFGGKCSVCQTQPSSIQPMTTRVGFCSIILQIAQKTLLGLTCTTVGEEKQHNPRLTKSKEEFIALMAGLGLPYPKKIDESLPANMVCGLQDLPERMKDWV